MTQLATRLFSHRNQYFFAISLLVSACGGGGNEVSGNVATGGATALATGGATASSGGTASGTGGAVSSGGAVSASGGGGPIGNPETSANLISRTHADGWIEPDLAASAVVIGAWFDYKFPVGVACDEKLTKAAMNGGNICFSATSCAGASAALGMNLCNLSNLDVSTWPEMQTFIETNGLSNGADAVFAFGQCNPGKKLVSVAWAEAMPAGKISFRDATDAALGVVPFADGATSLAIPDTIDGSKIAAIHFVFDGSVTKTWDFCVSDFTLSYL